MSKLQIYTVHLKPDAAVPHETVEFVREGFNLWAFIFTWMWALYSRQWWLAVGLLAVEGIISVLMSEALLAAEHAVIIRLMIQVLVGFFANDLQRWQLKIKGYITADIVAGESDLAAEYRFFERWLKSANTVPVSGA